MRPLVLLHRWLGVALGPFFAMWFASGMVMHFVPFPATNEAVRFAGLAPIASEEIAHGPAEAVAASGIVDATRVKLWRRNDGPVYLVTGFSGMRALSARDLADATIRSPQTALAIARDHARGRGIVAADARVAALAPYDQWTVSGASRSRGPLYRIACNDLEGTEIYVSSATGEVMLETTRRQRWWNYAGSVPHWIYLSVLRGRPALWAALVWWLSLAGLIGTLAGVVIGTVRIRWRGGAPRSPYRGWQAWHHLVGIVTMTFVLTWIVSGWLSMDDGALFSSGSPSREEIAAIAGAPDWQAPPAHDARSLAAGTREAEWFAFAGRIHRRDRDGPESQRFADTEPARAFLSADEVRPLSKRVGHTCAPPVPVDTDDAYRARASPRGTPVYRIVCGDIWLDIDGSNGAAVHRLDRSGRAYRWLYGGLHRLDWPFLTARPALRTALILVSCTLGFVFSLTGLVIGFRRLTSLK
jgi:hypothetical protein